jgi:hypothetical protein
VYDLISLEKSLQSPPFALSCNGVDFNARFRFKIKKKNLDHFDVEIVVLEDQGKPQVDFELILVLCADDKDSKFLRRIMLPDMGPEENSFGPVLGNLSLENILEQKHPSSNWVRFDLVPRNLTIL